MKKNVIPSKLVKRRDRNCGLPPGGGALLRSGVEDKKVLKGDRNQCPSCLVYFNSTSAFDKHRVGSFGERRCLSKNEMLVKGMAENYLGFWVGQKMKNFWLDEVT